VTSESGITVHWLPIPYSNHLSYKDRIKAFLKFALTSAKKAANVRGDLIFATSTPLTIALPGVYASRRQKIPMVFEVRDLWPELPIAMGALKNPLSRWLASCLERWAYNNASAVVALSPGMRQGVIKTGYPAEKVAVIPNSSDISFFTGHQAQAALFRQQRSWLQHRPLLVYAGTLGKINGVGYLVKLAKALETIAPEVRILVVGDGADRASIVSLARDNAVLNNNFFMEAKIPKKDVPVLFAAADGIVSLFIDEPAMRANSANKFFDALAAAKPVIINYGGWQNELIAEFDCGLNLWKRDVESAARLVAERIQDKTWLKSAGEASESLAYSFFDRDVLASQLEQVLLSVQRDPDAEVSSIALGCYQSAAARGNSGHA
jgi:glycosyltransferase involved in cell wall biosynthesis